MTRYKYDVFRFAATESKTNCDRTNEVEPTNYQQETPVVRSDLQQTLQCISTMYALLNTNASQLTGDIFESRIRPIIENCGSVYQVMKPGQRACSVR